MQEFCGTEGGAEICSKIPAANNSEDCSEVEGSVALVVDGLKRKF